MLKTASRRTIAEQIRMAEGVARESMIDLVREVAPRLGRNTVSWPEFFRETSLRDHHIVRHFEGYRDFCIEAGFEVDERGRAISDDEIVDAMRSAFLVPGPVDTTVRRFQKKFRLSAALLKSRFGDWSKSKFRFAEWLDRNRSVFPNRDQLVYKNGNHLTVAARQAGSDDHGMGQVINSARLLSFWS